MRVNRAGVTSLLLALSRSFKTTKSCQSLFFQREPIFLMLILNIRLHQVLAILKTIFDWLML